MSDRLWLSSDGKAELWLADSLDPEAVAAVMGDRKAQALIVDAPYSARTHKGHDEGALTEDRAKGFGRTPPATTDQNQRAIRRYASKKRGLKSGLKESAKLTYPPWSPDDVERFIDLWSPRTDGWICSLTDHELFPHWASSCAGNDRVTFAPLPFVETGSRVRMCGDGPSSWTCWLMVSRPRGMPYVKWGALRGAYVLPGERYFNATEKGERVIGGKPVKGMLMIVADYSRHGDLVVDPCCGAGTTGVAARTLGRRFIGIDTCREHLEISQLRLKKAREQVAIPFEERQMTQGELFAGAAPEPVAPTVDDEQEDTSEDEYPDVSLAQEWGQ